METYRGSCHCGAVQFEMDAEVTKVTECNCSICYKKGILHHRVPKERFRIVSGEDALSEYRFNTGAARHLFCATCGIHPFGHPRTHPDQVTVNLRCVDEPALDLGRLAVRKFDGQNWEQTIDELRRSGDY